MHLPDEQLRAGHIPTELYQQIPAGADPRKVVIVQEAPRNYRGPILLTLTITAGSVVVLLVAAFVVQIIAASFVAVLSASGGLSYTLNRANKTKGPKGRPVTARPSRGHSKRSPRPKRARSYRK
ncbi:hypothetical protein MMF93_24385 [Streptomyces tubbatahanensis]|uniref:DUF3040 domain-containing protein n=1 Tax=Streptomyces tubbatahanensis TaxID=2923272 RepID=A0ABY3XXK8_9ACTN|nr:hypothetical protein [Streptomyces tubbatahanensis]UNS99244.1 hypothetical protein MMF93_24385 [Streptomyces tubbatahanensis]